MITYSCKLVSEILAEVCAKFEKTKTLKIQRVRYRRDEKKYEVTLSGGAKRILEENLIKTYIESLGDKGALAIAGHLSHDPELENSIRKPELPETDEFWDGNMSDVYDYLNDKDKP